MGYKEPFPRHQVEGKGEFVAKLQDVNSLIDSLVFCKFLQIGYITPTHHLEWYKLVTGRDISMTEFLQYLNTQGILQQLADTYPLKRSKPEVPVWLYIASDLSLRLHGTQSFHGYPLVIRTGGLLGALGPKVGKKVVHPQSGKITIHCPGFNGKNKYDRETPCDQDWLRKTARATPAEKLLRWYNTEVPCLLEREGLFRSGRHLYRRCLLCLRSRQ